MLDEDSSSEDERRPKRLRVTWESETELLRTALPGTSTMTVEEVVARASSNKKKKAKKH